MKDEIDAYINSHYQRWCDYATYYCRISHVNVEPTEVLNNVLCNLLAGQSDIVHDLILRKGKNGLSEFDYFVLSIVKTNIISPRSTIRYVRGQHVTQRIGQLEYRIADERTDDNEEYEERLRIVRKILSELQVSELSKRIFLWRFEGNNYKDWKGSESLDFLYDTYNRIELLIRYEIWRKTKR